MNYFISNSHRGSKRIEITEEEYANLETAKNILRDARKMEEKYEMIILNYIDFEKQILISSVDNMIRTRFNYHATHETTLLFNLRLANLLTTVKLYEEHVKQDIKGCILNISNTKEIVGEFFSKEYDSHKEYRFMYELRNYVQHFGAPVHQTQIGASRTFDKHEYWIEISALKSFFNKDKKIKKKVLEESDDKIDLKKSTQKYIESISNIHQAIRKLINKQVSDARTTIENIHQRFKDEYNILPDSLRAFKISNNKEIISSFPLLLKWDDIRIDLIKRNSALINLSIRHVTGSKTQDDNC